MMNLSVLRRFTICSLFTLVAIPSILSAQTHVVNRADLQKAVLTATDMRQRNQETVTSILSSSNNAQNVLSAQTHVVNPADLQKAIIAATDARQRNMEAVTGFLSSSDNAQAVLGSVGIGPAQVKTAVSSLNDQELARLAARAEKAQADFAAGRMSERDLLWILIGLAALILIIIAAH